MRENRTWKQMKSDNDGASWIMDNGEFCVVTATKDGVIHYIAIEDINNSSIIVFQFGIGDQLIDVYLADEVKSLKEFEQLKDE